MSSPVSQAPSGFALSAVRTGEAVSSAGFTRWADEIAHVNGHLLHKAGQAVILPRAVARTSLVGLAHAVHVPWSCSAGVQVVRVTVELADSVEIGDTNTITTTLPSGAAWIDAGGLDGTLTIYNPATGRTIPREYVGWADVSACTVGALTDVWTFACVPSTKGAGVRRVTLVEVPLAGMAVDASEPGWDAAACRAGRPVEDGGASSARGVQRLWYCLDNGRANYRQHFLLSSVETADATAYGTTPHWSRESNALGSIDWLMTAGATDPTWYLATRTLYTSADAGNYSWRVRYRTDNATSCQIRMTAQGGALSGGAWTGASAATNQDMTLPGTSGAWAWVSQAATLPSDGTSGLVSVSFTAKGPGAGHLLSIATIALIENET